MIRVNTALCRNINNIRLLLIYYGRAVVDATWKGTVLNPIYSRLFYIVSGSATVTLNNDEKIMLEAGKWYLLPAGCSFTYACEKHLDHIYFHLKLCDMDEIDLFRNCPKPCVFSSGEDWPALFIRNLDSNTILDGLRVRQAVYDILLSVIEENDIAMQTKKLSPCVTDALHYINQNLSVDLSVGDIAEHVCVCPSTLTKKFKKELSLSVHAYIDDIVLFEACQLLAKGTLSIMAISEKFGFCDQFYFSRRFREKFGMSPREYRKQTML